VLAPQVPLHHDDAPAPIRDWLATRAWLDVSFASSPYIQPLELVPCSACGPVHGPIYLASDGFTVRPLPGYVDDYRDDAAALLALQSPEDAQLYHPLVFDPPLDQEPR